jgi:hypothetical protein
MSETRLAGSVEEILGGPRLGRLRRVDAKTIWADGGGQLAPWLRSNPDLLGDALRLEIRATANKQIPDVVGELTAGLPVIVKARFEDPADSDVHELAGLVAEVDAGVVVQVAPRIPADFREKLDKLNRNTAKLMTFYGVEFDLWQIDDSAPAPLFRVVAGPDGWDKAPARAQSGGGTSASGGPDTAASGQPQTAAGLLPDDLAPPTQG